MFTNIKNILSNMGKVFFKPLTTILACQEESARAGRDLVIRAGATSLLVTGGWQFYSMALRLVID